MTNKVGMIQSIKRAPDMFLIPLVPRGPLGPLMLPSCYARSNRSKNLAGNEDREEIVVEAGLCDGEGERAYIG